MMLQDVETGHAIELNAIVGAVHEIDQRLGIAKPHIAALLGLTRLLWRVRGRYPQQAPRRSTATSSRNEPRRRQGSHRRDGAPVGRMHSARRCQSLVSCYLSRGRA